jgi:tetratricopeptide (TPR) repeat protein
MSITDSALRPHLQALHDLQFTPLQTQEPDLTYTFKNVITQEVAYETLLFAQRRALHRTLADWYEKRMKRGMRDGDIMPNVASDAWQSAYLEQRVSVHRGDTPGMGAAILSHYLPLLAYHYRQAGIRDKERLYARLAGTRAAAQFANAEAVRYFTRALELTPEDDYAQRYQLLLSREKVHALQGKRDAQQRDLTLLELLVDAAENPIWQAEAALRRARYAEITGDYPATVAAARRAIKLAQSSNNQFLAASGYQQWGRALWFQGDHTGALPQLERALLLAREIGFGQVEADSMRSLGVIAYYQGNHDGGTICFERALGLFRNIPDLRGEAGALNNLGVVFYNRGDYARAREYYQQGLHIFRDVGHRQGEGRAIGNLGIIAHNLGDYTDAQNSYEQPLAIYREIDYRSGVSTLLSYLSLLFHHQGDQHKAHDFGWQAYSLARDLEDSLNQGFSLNNIGHALKAIKQWDAAVEAYQRAMEIRREAGQLNLAMESLSGLAEVCIAQDDENCAWLYVEQILGHLDSSTLDGAIEPFRVYLTCYHILHAHQDPRTQDVLAQAYQLLQERTNNITDAVLRESFLENVVTHREIVHEYNRVFLDK